MYGNGVGIGMGSTVPVLLRSMIPRGRSWDWGLEAEAWVGVLWGVARREARGPGPGTEGRRDGGRWGVCDTGPPDRGGCADRASSRSEGTMATGGDWRQDETSSGLLGSVDLIHRRDHGSVSGARVDAIYASVAPLSSVVPSAATGASPGMGMFRARRMCRLISAMRSGLSARNRLAFSRPWPSRTSP